MLKKDNADIEAERLLGIEISNAKRQRIPDIILILTLCLTVVALGIGIFIGKPDTFSEDENRSLQGYPEFSLKNFIGGEYTSDIGIFYSDQFPFRNGFVGLKGISEIAMGKMENDSVILGNDGYLVKRIEYGQKEYNLIEENLSAINDFSGAINALGIKFNFALAPRAIDIMDFKLPDHYSTVRSDKAWEKLSSFNGNIITFNEELKEHAKTDNYVWFRTDHHWTVEGAYIAYCKIAEDLSINAVPFSDFSLETVSDTFKGTTYSSSGIKFTPADMINLMRFDGDDKYTVTDMISQKTLLEGFYDFSYLDTKDKYSVFLGGNHSFISIKDDSVSDKPKMVIIKDSFANSVIPFLAIHYDIDVIDLREYKISSVYKLIEDNRYDNVLILYGIDSLATDDSLRYLRYGLK